MPSHNYRYLLVLLLVFFLNGCLPPANPYPAEPPAQVVAEAKLLSAKLEAYILKWTQGQVPARIPDSLIPKGISDCKNFYLKNPDSATAAETWAYRLAKPLKKDSLLTGIPDPKITYLYLGTALAPFGSKMVVEGSFPHCRFFSMQISPPLNGKEYYSQRQFGTAEAGIVDADIEPLPGNSNPFVFGANRNAANRKYRMEFDLTTGDPTTLNDTAHIFPYRQKTNTRKGAMLVYQGPLGFKTVAGTPLPVPGKWDLGCLWIRYYEPDAGKGPLAGVPMPKVYFQLPTGQKYFIASDFSILQRRADTTIPNRVTGNTTFNPNFGPETGWYKSWGITRSMLSGVCQANAWSRPDSGARVRAIDLGWTGRGEFQPAPGNIEPHATTNNYCTYFGRSVTIPTGMVAVLTGKLPTFPSTRNGEAIMQSGQVRYWSIVGIDADPLSPLPATTIHALGDDDVVIDSNRNYVIVYSNSNDKPANATTGNGATWVNYGTQKDMGLLIRWVNVSPYWTFPYAPQEHHLDWSHSDWAGTLYDSTLIGLNWRNGFMKCYLPVVHYMTKAQFEALGSQVKADNIPVWVGDGYTRAGTAESRRATVSASSVLDAAPANAAQNVNDGNMSSAWSSAFGQPAQSITFDLGAVKKISAIKLNWDWIFFGKAYTLKTSNDNSNWQTVTTVTNGDGAVDLFSHIKNTSGRYVKLELTNYNVGYYRLGEFEVYIMDCDCSTTAPPLFTGPAPGTGDGFKIYPNPASQVINYVINKFNPAVKYQLAIYDTKGGFVLQKNILTDTGAVNIGHLKQGAYIFTIFEGSKRIAKPFVKKE
jgi:hypothetical protein